MGYIVSKGKLRMDPTKVMVSLEWEPLTEAVELRSFLGLINYYRRFIKCYPTVATPLIKLWKKKEDVYEAKSSSKLLILGRRPTPRSPS